MADGTFTLGNLTFDNANTYTLSGSGTNAIVLQTSYGNAAIAVYSGSHEIAAPIQLNSYADVSVAALSTLTISGPIHGSGTGLTLKGDGTVILSGAGSDYSGGAAINAGKLQLGSSSALGSGPVSIISGYSTANSTSPARPSATRWSSALGRSAPAGPVA